MLIVRIIDDDIIELDETYNLSISIATSRRVIVGENSTTTITIKNDDCKYVTNYLNTLDCTFIV